MDLEIRYANTRIKKSLDKYTRKQKEKILNAIEDKLKNLGPFTKGIKKIKTKTKENWYRLEVDDFRIIYKREKDVIMIMKITLRKDAYKW